MYRTRNRIRFTDGEEKSCTGPRAGLITPAREQIKPATYLSVAECRSVHNQGDRGRV